MKRDNYPMLLVITLLFWPQFAASDGAKDASQWQKLDAKGHQVALKMGPWHCAKDTHTGLTWEVKSWQEDEHYYKATYSYFDPLSGEGVKDGGSCHKGFEWYPCDVSDYIDTLNQQAYCGITRWRLPSLMELQTLLYHKNIEGKLSINPYIFPRTTRTVYMTSDITRENGQLKIAMMDFFKRQTSYRSAEVVANVRLVSN